MLDLSISDDFLGPMGSRSLVSLTTVPSGTYLGPVPQKSCRGTGELLCEGACHPIGCMSIAHVTADGTDHSLWPRAESSLLDDQMSTNVIYIDIDAETLCRRHCLLLTHLAAICDSKREPSLAFCPRTCYLHFRDEALGCRPSPIKGGKAHVVPFTPRGNIKELSPLRPRHT